MRKLLFILLLISFAFTTSPLNAGESDTGAEIVYICTGPKSKKYHRSEQCRGLDKCSSSISAVSVAEAKSMGRTPCKICY